MAPPTETVTKEGERVRLDGGGYYDRDIYDISNGNKYANYVESIGVDDLDVSIGLAIFYNASSSNYEIFSLYCIGISLGYNYLFIQ